MIYAIVTVLILIADQAVKFWTTKNIVLDAVGEECVRLIPGFVHMTNVHNYGAAFGILQNARWPLAIVSLIFVIVIIVLINREVIHTRFGKWVVVLVMAGAIGNCIDRMLYGYVVDMFEFEFSLMGKPFQFPVFNVADIFITVFGILFCLHVLFHNEPAAVREANAPEFIRKRRQREKERDAQIAAITAKARAEKEASARRNAGILAAEDAFADLGDSLGTWDFGADAPELEPEPDPEPVRKPVTEAVRPQPSTLPAEEDPVFDTGEKDEVMEFSLEDILSEFGED